MTIRTQDQPDQVVTTESPGTNSVLNLNPDTVRFFVGGVPMDARVCIFPNLKWYFLIDNQSLGVGLSHLINKGLICVHVLHISIGIAG